MLLEDGLLLVAVTVFFLFIMKMATPATRITPTDAPTAMPAIAPTLRPSSESVFAFAGPTTRAGGGGEADAPDPETNDAGAVTMAAALEVSDIAVAMVVLAAAAMFALSYPMLMVSTTLPASALMSTFPGATPISRDTFSSMAVSTGVVNVETSPARVIFAMTKWLAVTVKRGYRSGSRQASG